ncbi:MAG TPA: alpha/beta fold hydrolase [Thermoanaerobaculia bacterium]|jgi:pimeloyl-ACP methyl ester carboxylesterase|nr:alpha/beta fold hydrolase [Thermoanaerobaculia bacterium]
MALLHRIGKKVFFGRFQKKWRWPADVPQDGWERVQFKAHNGARLAAVFGAAEAGQASGAVVLAHPMGVAAKGFWLKHGHAGLLRRNGFDVLAFDFNGFGESESADFDYPGDAVAAGEYLRQRVGHDAIGLVGASFGAGYALCAMSRDAHPYRAAVLEGAFPSLPYFWRSYPIPHFLLRVSQFMYPSFERRLRPILAAAELKSRPRVLLVHGDADQVSPVSVGTQLQQAMSNRADADLWIVPAAQHTLAYAAQRDEYARRVTDFLRRSLGNH